MDHEVPLSNHTSIVSVPFLHSSARVSSNNFGGKNPSTGPSHQYSAPLPFASKTLRMWVRLSALRTTLSEGVWGRGGMGTPQTRWREIHHSDRERMKDSRRLRAVKGWVDKCRKCIRSR